MRSATTPEMIVATVPQNIVWNRKNDISQGSPGWPKKNLVVPNKPTRPTSASPAASPEHA